MEAQQHASNMPNSANTENTERGTITPTSDTLKSTEEETEEEEEEEEIEDEWSQEELQTQPSPTIHQGSPPSPDGDCEEESAGRMSPHHPVELQHGPEEAELQGERNSLSEEEEEHGPRGSETLLQGTVERLKAALETHRWTQTGEAQTGEAQTGGLRQVRHTQVRHRQVTETAEGNGNDCLRSNSPVR